MGWRPVTTIRARTDLAALISALLLSALTLGISAPQASAVAALYSEVAEEMGNNYAEASCREDGPDC